MKNNIENWTDELFEWIQTYSFDQLNTDQQYQVLSMMSLEDYNEMYEANLMINSNQRSHHRREDLKLQALNAFDQQHQKSFLTTNVFWKAASVLLFLATTILGYQKFSQPSQTSEPIVLHDTIYVDKEVAPTPSPLLAHSDSMEKSKPSFVPNDNPSIQPKRKENKQSFKMASHRSQNQTNIEVVQTSTANEIPVASLSQLHSLSNSNKRNSRKFDSIEQSMPFVSL